MNLRKTYRQAGAVWAAPLAGMAALATLNIFLRAGRSIPDFESLLLIVVVLAALMAFAGSIVAGDSYGERLARKKPWPRAGKFGALLIVVGVMANVFLVLAMLTFALPHDDEMNSEIFMEELARESAGE
ncbi:MAG: hypothetical protein V3S44_10920 [Alphaproteobacteria bacterium]